MSAQNVATFIKSRRRELTDAERAFLKRAAYDALLRKQRVEQRFDGQFSVLSDTGHRYTVTRDGGEFRCRCAGFSAYGYCKHSDAAAMHVRQRLNAARFSYFYE